MSPIDEIRELSAMANGAGIASNYALLGEGKWLEFKWYLRTNKEYVKFAPPRCRCVVLPGIIVMRGTEPGIVIQRDRPGKSK